MENRFLVFAVLAWGAFAGGPALGAPGPVERGEALRALVRNLGDSDFGTREEAYRALMELAMRDPKEILAILPEDVLDPEIQFRCERLRWEIFLESRRLAAQAAVAQDPFLCKQVDTLLDEPSWSAVRNLHREAWQRGHSEETVIYFLSLILPCLEGEAREAAFLSLSDLRAETVIPDLAKSLEEESPETRKAACRALGRMKRVEALRRLLPFLKDPQADVREACVKSIEQLGDVSGAGDCVPAVLRYVEDGTPQIRLSAAEALGFLGDPSVVKRLMEKVEQEEHSQVGQAAAVAVWRLAGCPWARARIGLDQDDVALARRWWAAHKSEPQFRPPDNL